MITSAILSAWRASHTTPRMPRLAVEPSAAMRDLSVFRPVLAGEAAAIPLPDSSVDAVWISTVIHHVPDLAAAAAELRRVLRPGAVVLIRSAFAGRPEGITQFRYFTEAVRVLDTYPSVADIEQAFTGFRTVKLSKVPQHTASSLQEIVATLRREAHTPLQLITDEEYAAGLERLRTAAETATGPVIDHLDLLVMRTDPAGSHPPAAG
ncbi:class I SAM-dependent methyltransferase [Winogradskya humida]|uniref:class I SAM-dependent methyltransferase n=1 Tax=Winogradskya humida TaxID=113566 RepID=UPI003F68FF23